MIVLGEFIEEGFREGGKSAAWADRVWIECTQPAWVANASRVLGLDADRVRFVAGFGRAIMEERERQMELEAAHETALAEEARRFEEEKLRREAERNRNVWKTMKTKRRAA